MKHLAATLGLILASTSILLAQEADTIPAPQEPVQEAPQPPEQPSAQEAPAAAPAPKKKGSVKDKLYYGGHVNFSIGSYSLIGIEPYVGYKIIPRLSAGATFRYDYISDNRYQQNYNTHTWGGSVFSRLVLFRGLYAHVEAAQYNYEFFYSDGSSQREWVPFVFVGGGFSRRIGKRSSLNAQVLFDVLQDSDSPYRRWEPFYTVGVGVGF